jgi:hypothetical protein
MQFREPKQSGNAHQRRVATRKWWKQLDASLKRAAGKILGMI